MSISRCEHTTYQTEPASQQESQASHLILQPKCETDEQLLKELAKDDLFGIIRIQRLMGWGYNRAARKAEELLAEGITKQLPGSPYKFFVAGKADQEPDKQPL